MFDIGAVSPLVWILIGIGLLAALLNIIIGPGRYRQLTRMVRMQGQQGAATVDENEEAATDASPMVSIIAYSKGHPDEVSAFLQAVSEQDYVNKEVIIVIDGPAREAANLTETFASYYPWVSFSFVPPEALNLSRRKLANTIGIKKAEGEIILTTLTNVVIPSRQWLSMMCSQFKNSEVEIVLGAAFQDLTLLKGPKQWYRRFDALLTASRWMLYAIDGNPYRGDGANLAFRRSLFFNNSGYGNNYFLHAGDDDIFVSQVATSSNSRFMFAPQATLKVDWGAATRRQWINLKERYTFTARYLSAAPRRRTAVLNLSDWIATGCLAAAMAISFPTNLIPPVIAVPLLLAFLALQIACYRALASTFHSTRLFWSIPLFYLIRPIADFCFRIRYSRQANLNFTWRR